MPHAIGRRPIEGSVNENGAIGDQAIVAGAND
jgi:hypothetical protein